MAKVRNPLQSFAASGSIADMLTFRQSSGRAIVSRKTAPSGAPSAPQSARRDRYKIGSTYWQTLSPSEKAAWVALGEPLRITGYNAYISWWMTGSLKYDPFYANVSALLHMLGADGGIIFTDEKAAPITRYGDTQTDTDQYKWEGSSGLFDGSGDYLTMPANAAYDMGSGDFTIDLWVRLATESSRCAFAYSKPSHDALADIAFYANIESAGLQFSVCGNGLFFVAQKSVTLPLNTWAFLRCTRSGVMLQCAIDGAPGAAVNIGAISLHAPAGRILKIGRRDTYAPLPFNGHMQDFRITKGIARSLTEVPDGIFPDM